MNFLTGLIAVVFLAIILAAALWIGVYVVLPLILLSLIVSAIVAIIKSFMPAAPQRHKADRVLHNTEKIIDVEYEEVK